MRRLTIVGLLASLMIMAGCATDVSPPPAAENVATLMAASVEGATRTVTFTVETDPNKMLGRPNGYVSKASFSDPRISPTDVPDSRDGSVEAGGSVEVFETPEMATNRMRQIVAITANAPMLSEYTYTSGRVVLRVSRLLTPTQAADYQRAFDSSGVK